MKTEPENWSQTMDQIINSLMAKLNEKFTT